MSRTCNTLDGILSPLPRLLADRTPKNDAAACRVLAAFLATVSRYEQQGTLTHAQADELRTLATNIKVKIGCT